MKDWKGNKAATFATLGATSHGQLSRAEHDYYATEPLATELLLGLEKFNQSIWECACGEGHLSKVLEKHGYNVKSTDLIDRDFGIGGVDFLEQTEIFDGDIITNPPYKMAQQFVEKSLELIPGGNRVAMFLKVQFLEGKARKKMFAKYPPKIVYISSSRIKCAKNGEFDKIGSSAVCYCWYIWEKGYKGETIVKWFN